MNILASYIYTDTFYKRPGASAAKYTSYKLVLLQYPGIWERLPLWLVSESEYSAQNCEAQLGGGLPTQWTTILVI